MKGGIYSDQRCAICGGHFRHFEPRGLWCQEHPDQQPTRLKMNFGTVTRRFRSYDSAWRMLNGLRYKTDDKSFDIRDYQTSNPLGFEKQVTRWLKTKRNKPKAQKRYAQHMAHAIAKWGDENVKAIGFGEFEDILLDLEDVGLASKTRFDFMECVKGFYRWLNKREGIQLPDFPEVEYHMARRKTVPKDTQWQILEVVRELTWAENPRIYIACLFLSTYVNMRPNELRNVREGDVDLDSQRIYIPKPKEKEPKYVYLIEEDVELLRSISEPSHPNAWLFRHVKNRSGVMAGHQFSKNFLNTWWHRACDELGVSGVSVYPGTRHSTAQALRESGHSSEDVKRAMGTRSAKAFDRYLEVTGNEMRGMSEETRITLNKKEGVK